MERRRGTRQSDMRGRQIQLRNTLLLVLGSVIWGMAFVAQSVGSEYVGPYTFLAARSWLACLFLMAWILLRHFCESRKEHRAVRADGRCASKTDSARLWKNPGRLMAGGLLCGIFLFSASASQQMGIANTETTAKAGFVTALYVVLVPVIQQICGKRTSGWLWICVGVSLIGLYLLCLAGKESFSLTGGEWQLLLCALLFAFQILCVGKYSPQVDVIQLSFAEFLVTAVLSTVFMLWREAPTWEAVRGAAVSVAYCGILSSGVGYTLQVIGQRDLDPTIASLAMCLESVFSALGGFLILHQRLSAQELAGCLLMFAAIAGAQLPEKKRAS